jgi:hypothetical protein
MPDQPALAKNWRLYAVWPAVALFLSLQIYLEHHWPADWRGHAERFGSQFLRCALWALATPLVVGLHGRLAAASSAPWRLILRHLAWSVFCVFLVSQLRVWIHGVLRADWSLDSYLPVKVLRGLNPRLLIDWAVYWAIVCWAQYALTQRRARAAELHEERLQTALARAELAALKQQIQPHFLFNSLNAVAGLVREGRPDRAVESLAQLSSLLRLLITTSGRLEVDLALELDYVQRYLAVEQLRFGDRLQTRFEVDAECLPALVPTLLLQPLIENAIKHGIARRASPGRILVRARRDGAELRLEVVNDPAEDGAPPADGHGVGLSATRARLQRAYGADFHLEWRLDGPRGAAAMISLPFRPAPASP